MGGMNIMDQLMARPKRRMTWLWLLSPIVGAFLLHWILSDDPVVSDPRYDALYTRVQKIETALQAHKIAITGIQSQPQALFDTHRLDELTYRLEAIERSQGHSHAAEIESVWTEIAVVKGRIKKLDAKLNNPVEVK